MGRNAAQLLSKRAINRHERKSSRVWQMETIIAEIDNGAGRQKSFETELVTLSPIEVRVTEKEASVYGFTHQVGLTKLLIPGDVSLSTMTKLLCDGNEVNIIQMPGRHFRGQDEYHVLFVMIRSEDT